jgi:hypothetical protein
MFAAGVGAPAKQAAAAASAVDASVKSALQGCFDGGFYASKYADVKAAYGDKADALFGHFIDFGIHEGRMVNADFDPKAYIQAYPDVAAYCNGDYCKAYEHWIKYGKPENRTLTTFAKLGTQPAPAAAASSSGSGSTPDEKKKVDIGYGLTVTLTKEEMNNSHIEVVKSDYGYGAFVVDNTTGASRWVGGTEYYFPWEEGKTVQTIDLDDYVNPSGGNYISEDYLPVYGNVTVTTDTSTNGIPVNRWPLAENEAIDVWGDSNTTYNVSVGFGEYNQAYADTGVLVTSNDSWFYEETETETWGWPGVAIAW